MRVKILLVLFCSMLANAKTILTQPDLSKININYEKYSLPNGLEVILSPDKSTNFVTINIWYKVGSIHEKPNKTGLAHLFEHLMFEGSKHYAQDQHFKILERIGASNINASTSFDKTNYYETVFQDDLEIGLSMESSRMGFLVLNDAKRKEQLAVVRREREVRYETRPYAQAGLSLWQQVFAPSDPRYGYVIGSHRDLENARLKDLQSFYNENYGPTNASLALVGNFDVDTAKNLINKYFGTLPKNDKIIDPKLPIINFNKEEIVTYQDRLASVPLIRIFYTSPGLYKEGDAAMDVIAHALGNGQFSRLYNSLVREAKIASSVNAYQQSMQGQSFFGIDVTPAPGVSSEAIIEKVDEVLQALSTKGITDVELQRARNSILTTYFFGLQGLQNRAEILQTYNLYTSNPGFIQKDLARYYSLTLPNLISMAKEFLPIKTNRKILVVLPK